jgi:hypothetical protein
MGSSHCYCSPRATTRDNLIVYAARGPAPNQPAWAPTGRPVAIHAHRARQMADRSPRATRSSADE